MDPDDALMRAWNLFIEDSTDAVIDELETLLPMLLRAGYAATDDGAGTWWFTQKGVARAEAIEEADRSAN